MGRKRENQIRFRVTDDEWASIHGLSGQVNLSMEEFIRRCVLSDKKIVVQDGEAIRGLTSEIHHIGNNVNQIARIANGEKTISEPILRELIAWQEEIYQKLHEIKQFSQCDRKTITM